MILCEKNKLKIKFKNKIKFFYLKLSFSSKINSKKISTRTEITYYRLDTNEFDILYVKIRKKNVE